MTDCIHGPAEGFEHMGVKDPATYRAAHASQMKRKEQTPHEVSEPQHAYINHGRWVVSCKCVGAGLTSPSFGISCCFDCGAVYTHILFPADVDAITHALLQRDNVENRNWTPDESLESLVK